MTIFRFFSFSTPEKKLHPLLQQHTQSNSLYTIYNRSLKKNVEFPLQVIHSYTYIYTNKHIFSESKLKKKSSLCLFDIHADLTYFHRDSGYGEEFNTNRLES